ncbi:uncharacterized protein PITG_00195 [Phytophthora infestans T30-4]|uniref:Transposase n=1 Tax=Phytophthora infestans (strain T30-4) TaxID=403677 RepID=D0MQ65_PHYIT|nr:uncharacterized protein PITG_00195 [Phytophthora infestans T30-4]EEY57634.1 conserved hypothetical protein [Phytophthora infestans T30-4]|eukprot:XP_002908820.1 conserved hypothetical protein [Phytophthora infestans T30-4]
MKHDDLSFLRRTYLTTLTDEQLLARAISYMRYLSASKSTFNFHHTVLMDETAVHFEDAREQTVEVRGARHVVVKSTEFQSMRVTTVLAHKKGSRNIQKVVGVYVSYQPKAWIDSDLLCNWIDTVG